MFRFYGALQVLASQVTAARFARHGFGVYVGVAVDAGCSVLHGLSFPVALAMAARPAMGASFIRA